MTSRLPLRPGWTVALAGVAGLAVLAVLPPIIGGEAGAVLHHAFAAVCHQIPERTPHLAGGPIALCHRCSGILAGLLVGVAAAPSLGGTMVEGIVRSRQGLALVLSGLPTAIDWALGATGVWANTPLSRMLTGALFGIVAGLILGANLLTVPRPSLSPTLTDA